MKNRSFPTRVGFAIHGLTAAVRREKSLKVHFAGLLFITVFCLWQKPDWIWCAAFYGMACLVMTLELVNSAVEAVVDRLHPEIHPEIGFAKDALAGAVLLASLTAVLIFSFYLVHEFVK